MTSPSKIILLVFSFFVVFWLSFVLIQISEIAENISYLNTILAVLFSGVAVFFITKRKLHYDRALLNSTIFWAVGFVLGLVYVQIFDPNDGQGIFLSILWTGPISWVLGLIVSFFIAKPSQVTI